MHNEPIRSTRAAGADTVTRFMARDEDQVALLDSDIDHIDILVMRRGDVEPFWQKKGLPASALYQGSPQAWEKDDIGYLWEHRLAWYAEDDYGERYEPASGSTVKVFFWLWRTGTLGPVVVKHVAGYDGSPRAALDS